MKSAKLTFLYLLTPFILFGQTSIFSNHTHFTYLATYTDSLRNIHIQDTIYLTSSNTPWYVSPKRQKTIVWEYQTTLNANIKKQIHSLSWLKYDTTGFIENDKEIFIHPPRCNQYSYTEVAPFPQINYPLEIGKTYKKILFTGSHLGEWSNLKFINQYKIIKQEKITILEEQRTGWFIQSTSTSKLGVSKMNFIFNTDIGFIKLHYLFYDHKEIKLQLLNYK